MPASFSSFLETDSAKIPTLFKKNLTNLLIINLLREVRRGKTDKRVRLFFIRREQERRFSVKGAAEYLQAVFVWI